MKMMPAAVNPASVSDVCDRHGFPSTFWHPEKARR